MNCEDCENVSVRTYSVAEAAVDDGMTLAKCVDAVNLKWNDGYKIQKNATVWEWQRITPLENVAIANALQLEAAWRWASHFLL